MVAEFAEAWGWTEPDVLALPWYSVSPYLEILGRRTAVQSLRLLRLIHTSDPAEMAEALQEAASKRKELSLAAEEAKTLRAMASQASVLGQHKEAGEMLKRADYLEFCEEVGIDG